MELAGLKTRQVQGLLDQSNRVDIYQLSLVGRNRYRARFDFEADQGACKVALGLADTKGKVTFSTAPLRSGKALARELRPYMTVNGEDVPPEGKQSSTLYIKLFRPTQDISYKFSINYKELN